MDDISEQWIGRAQYDLDSAHAMFKAGRYLYVLFCCQQAVEKMLKSIVAQRTRELPPRTHKLSRLAELAGPELDERQIDFLRELSAYYIPTRYPEDVADINVKKRAGPTGIQSI
jgi:HEPN domain-containing protein